MAETVSLFLKANGSDIQGESTITSLGREDSIECLYFESAVRTLRESGTARATGRRQYEPLLIRKRIDKSSPLIAKALSRNEVIEGTFKFFRANPAGDGTTQHFFTVEIVGGRVASLRMINPNSQGQRPSDDPPMEEVTFVFHTITWTYEDGGVTHTDSWSEQA